MLSKIEKKILKDNTFEAILKTNNIIAARDIILRVTVELFLIVSVYFLIENDKYILSALTFYILAIWHSFWGYAGIGHELMHSRVFASRKLNRIIYYLSSFLVWNNPEFFRKTHLFHHAHTFDPRDSEAKGVQKWSLIPIISYLTIDFPSMIRKTSYAIINSIGFKNQNGTFLKISLKEQLSAVMLIVFQLITNIIIYIITESIIFNVLWIILPFCGQFINKILAQSQHLGLQESYKEGVLHGSRSIRLPKILEFLYASMNYHAEHHLLPSTPYYNLEKLSHLISNNTDHRLTEWLPFFKEEFWLIIKKQKQY